MYQSTTFYMVQSPFSENHTGSEKYVCLHNNINNTINQSRYQTDLVSKTECQGKCKSHYELLRRRFSEYHVFHRF